MNTYFTVKNLPFKFYAFQKILNSIFCIILKMRIFLQEKYKIHSIQQYYYY